MNSEKSKFILQTLSLGLISGMRSIAGPAIASHILSKHHSKTVSHSFLKFLQSDKVAMVLKVLAAGEFIGDKLPLTPDRVEPLSVLFRCVSGSIVVAGIFKASGKRVLNGVMLGGLTAVCSTFGSFYLRKVIAKNITINDPFIGVVEDALVVGAGLALIANY